MAILSDSDYTFLWSNNDLKIIGSPNKKLETALSYTKKSLEYDAATRSRKTKFSRERVYNYSPVKDRPGLVQYQTFQGLLDLCRNVLKKQGFTSVVKDCRIPFVQPRLELMHGFRFNQRELLTEALKADRSGTIGAPTRYGKTVLITNCINAFPGVKTAILAPGIDLLPQLKSAVQTYCPNREVKGLFTGSRDKYESDDITICSFDSMHKLDKESFKLVLIDEPHAVVSDSRAPQLVEFSSARILGFGATLEGRWSGNDIMIEGLIGPTIAETTYKECVKMGALCPIHVYMLAVPFTPRGYKRRNHAYDAYVFKNGAFHDIVGEICNNVLPEGWQTLVFINNEAEARLLQPKIAGGVLAMDKLMRNKKERTEIFERLKKDEIKRCICSNIYSTGVTIDNIRAEINCDAGGGGILSVQKPGRLAEIKPGKKEGIMIDFLFTPSSAIDPSSADGMIQRDAFNRLQAYQSKGYDIDICQSLEEMKEKILQNNL